MNNRDAKLQALLRLADDHLILGHRLSEWCGHAPMLEEDLAMPNMALDLLGQARVLYTYAAEVEGKGRSEDDFAYLRTEDEYCNLLLAERPNGDFAHTMLRQFYFAAFMENFWNSTLQSSDETLAGIAGKAVKEIAYHVRHTGEWIIRLGDGTKESHERMQAAVHELHPYVDELFVVDSVCEEMLQQKLLPDPQSLRSSWENTVGSVFAAAKISVPETCWPKHGGRQGRHGEEMGFLLAELQYMQRTYPGLAW